MKYIRIYTYIYIYNVYHDKTVNHFHYTLVRFETGDERGGGWRGTVPRI